MSLFGWPEFFVGANLPWLHYGIDFGANAPERHVRFAYTNSIERLQEGVRRIGEFLRHR